MYVRHEAVLSSQIEGTQSTLGDVLEFEADAAGGEHPRDVREVVNYVAALDHGLSRLESLPLSLRLIREIHERLMVDVRGGERTPGEFRRSQNFIGPQGGTLADAAFVPPPVHEMHEALSNLEKLLHDRDSHPVLTARMAEAHLGTSFVTAARTIDSLAAHGLLREITHGKRNRKFRFEPYVALFEKPVVGDGEAPSTGRTGEAR